MDRHPDLEFSGVDVNEEDGAIRLMAQGEYVHRFAVAAAKILEDTELVAPNYVQYKMRHPLIERTILVTVQWADGMSPSEKATMLEKKLTDLQGRYDALVSAFEDTQPESPFDDMEHIDLIGFAHALVNASANDGHSDQVEYVVGRLMEEVEGGQFRDDDFYLEARRYLYARVSQMVEDIHNDKNRAL